METKQEIHKLKLDTDKEIKEKLSAARQQLSETRNIHIIKPDRRAEHV